MVRKLCSGQEMLYKINQTGIIKKTEQGRVTVRVHCTLSHCQKHTYEVFRVIQTYDDKVTLRPRKAGPRGRGHGRGRRRRGRH